MGRLAADGSNARRCPPESHRCPTTCPSRPPARPLSTRRSPRAARSAPSCRRRLPRQTIEEILAVAARAPSGTNTQPWHVYVLTRRGHGRAVGRILAAYDDPAERTGAHRGVRLLPDRMAPPFIDRRRKVGWDLYGLLGHRQDRQAAHARPARAQLRVLRRAGRPDVHASTACMQQGSWLDYGMFLQNVMVAARGRGLDTCPQAAFTQFHRIITPARAARRRDGGLRHVARLRRPGRDREHARHRARAGASFTRFLD